MWKSRSGSCIRPSWQETGFPRRWNRRIVAVSCRDGTGHNEAIPRSYGKYAPTQPTKTNNDGNARFTAFETRIVALENSRSPGSNKTREATHEQEQRSTRAVATGFIANSREEETMIFLRLVVVREVGIERETEAIICPSKTGNTCVFHSSTQRMIEASSSDQEP